MPITGSQKAKMYARLGVMRVGASRLDYYKPVVAITINGTTRTGNCRIADLTIRDYLDGAPNIATLRVDGFTPTAGHEIRIGLGALDRYHRVFAGNVQTVNQTYDTDDKANVVWELTCTSYEWLLNRRKVNYRYLSQSASDIATHLITNNSTSFTTVHVEPGLPAIDEITFTNEDLTDCLDRLARRIGGYWYIDYDRDLHFYVTINLEGRAQDITDGAVHGMYALPALSVTSDLAPVRTRVYVEGGGGTAVAPLANGQTTIPIDDSSWYNASGGTVVVGVNRVTYTGVSGDDGTGSTAGTPVSAPDVSGMSASAAAGGSFSVTTYWFVITYITGEGESTQSDVKSITLTGGNQTFSFTNIPTGPSTVTARRIYFTSAGSSGPFDNILKTINDNTTSSYSDPSGAEETGSQTPPTVNGAGYAQAQVDAGAITLPVGDASNFSSGGGWVLAAGQYIRFTGKSGNTLTGVPDSGIGAITAAITVGTEAINVPHLTGIPSVADGSIGYFRPAGEPINLLVMSEDATAQTAMATAVGGDGIHEEYFQDNRLSETEARAQADAHLSQLKDPLVTVRYDTSDQSTRSGKKVTFNLSSPTSLAGTFKIQSVLLTGFSADGSFFPRRGIEASNRRQSFEALIRILRKAA